MAEIAITRDYSGAYTDKRMQRQNAAYPAYFDSESTVRRECKVRVNYE